jgi:hypothetical protein
MPLPAPCPKRAFVPSPAGAFILLDPLFDGLQRPCPLPLIGPSPSGPLLFIPGITRKVTVLDPLTREGVVKPINEVASSHLARRCFIGNLYKKVKDPNLVGSLSGHVEGSKAFSRYRDIDDEMKFGLVSLLEK